VILDHKPQLAAVDPAAAFASSIRMRIPFTAGLDSDTIGPDRSCAVPTTISVGDTPVAPAPERRRTAQALRRRWISLGLSRISWRFELSTFLKLHPF